MAHPVISFTAVYLKSKHGYVGFVEELPGPRNCWRAKTWCARVFP